LRAQDADIIYSDGTTPKHPGERNNMLLHNYAGFVGDFLEGSGGVSIAAERQLKTEA